MSSHRVLLRQQLVMPLAICPNCSPTTSADVPRQMTTCSSLAPLITSPQRVPTSRPRSLSSPSQLSESASSARRHPIHLLPVEFHNNGRPMHFQRRPCRGTLTAPSFSLTDICTNSAGERGRGPKRSHDAKEAFTENIRRTIPMQARQQILPRPLNLQPRTHHPTLFL